MHLEILFDKKSKFSQLVMITLKNELKNRFFL